MDLTDHLIAATRERAHDPLRATDNGSFQEQSVLPALTLAAVLELDAQLPHRMPALFHRLYSEVGNGGFGPGYGLLELEDAVDNCLAFSPHYRLPPHQWMFPFVDWGCSLYSVVDLATGRVGLLDQDWVDEELTVWEAIRWQFKTAQDYWQAWLDGANLFEFRP